jgi:hypothetical protein
VQARQIKRDLELERKRLDQLAKYREQLESAEVELEYNRRRIQYMKEEEDQKKDLAQKKKDAKNLSAVVSRMQEEKEVNEKQAAVRATADLKPHKSKADPVEPAEKDWEWLKTHHGADSEALDKLMSMIGLNDVKQEFLSVKNKVDTLLRQRASLACERFNCSMLGNPGTGMFLGYSAPAN